MLPSSAQAGEPVTVLGDTFSNDAGQSSSSTAASAGQQMVSRSPIS